MGREQNRAAKPGNTGPHGLNYIKVAKRAIFIRALTEGMVFTEKDTSTEIREPEADCVPRSAGVCTLPQTLRRAPGPQMHLGPKPLALFGLGQARGGPPESCAPWVRFRALEGLPHPAAQPREVCDPGSCPSLGQTED